MKILDLINTDNSAKELLDHRVAQVNATGRHQNDIYCSSGPYVDRLRAKGHRVHAVDTPRGLGLLGLIRAIWTTVRLLRRERYDVIHTHGSVIGLIGRLAAFFARTPWVVHQVHGFHHHPHMRPLARGVFIWVERLLSVVTDRVLFQNQTDLDECRARRIAPERKLVLIGNGVQLDQFQVLGEPSNDPPVVLCVARFEPVKNHGLILEAARLLKERGLKFLLKLAGDGETRADCEAWAAEHSLTDCVRFLGYCDDVPGETARAEVCTLVSIKEGIPRAIIEAAACGRPIVATDVSGNRDGIVDGVTGYLVPLNNAAALADRIQTLMADPDQRATIGRQARAHAEAHFNERVVTERILEVYEQGRNPQEAVC